MDGTTQTQPLRSGLPRPKSADLLRPITQPKPVPQPPSTSNRLQPPLARKPSTQLRRKPSTTLTTPAVPLPAPSLRARSGITNTGKTQIIPKGPVEKVKKLVTARSMLHLPTRSSQLKPLSSPAEPLGAKRIISSASTRSTVSTTPSADVVKQKAIPPRATSVRPLALPSQLDQPKGINTRPPSRLAASRLYSSSSSPSSGEERLNPPRPLSSQNDIFSTIPGLKPPSTRTIPQTTFTLHLQSASPLRTQNPPSHQSFTTSRKLPPSLVETPLLPRMINMPFTARQGMGLEMIKDTEMSFEDSSGEFSPIAIRHAPTQREPEEEPAPSNVESYPSAMPKVIQQTATEKSLTEAEAGLALVVRELEQSRRNEARVRREHFTSLQEGLIGGIEEQLSENEGVKRMIASFREMICTGLCGI